MNGMVAWFARNPVAANLLMVAIVVGGFISASGVKREIFPSFSMDTITVSVPYPGAAPTEVEESICIRIEEEVQGIEGVKKLTSTGSEGSGMVVIEIMEGADLSRVLDDVKSRIDAIDNFPVDAEEPVIREMTFKRQVLNIAISGDLEELPLKRIAEQVRDEVTALDGITQVDLVAVKPYEISIEVSEAALRRYQLSFDDVANAVRRSSLDLPGGSIKTSGGEILLRTKGQAYVGRDFESIVVITKEDGTRVRIDDVATVVDGFAEVDQETRFDGEPAALVQVFRVGDQDALQISDSVKAYCESAEHRLPEGITLTPWLDQSEILLSRQNLLVRNGIGGFILVFLVLALFLRLDLAIWVSLGIPISFLGALWLMPFVGVSVNMLSLFAFILVLGIVVDDAIVVGENVYSHNQRGKKGLLAAIEGTQEVAVPVTFAVLTTIAAFSPMLNVPGNTGPFWAVIPAIVIPTLVFSMIESKLILPAHLRHMKPRDFNKRGIMATWNRCQRFFASGLEAAAEKTYKPVLGFALRNRYLVAASALAVFALTVGVVRGGYVKFIFFPAVEGDNVVAALTMPQGTPVTRTEEIVRRMEAAALQVRDEMAADTSNESTAPIRHVLTSIGEQPYSKIQAEGGGRMVTDSFSSSHLGEVNIQLAPSELRTHTSEEVSDRWRELVGPVHGATKLEYSASLINVGADIDIHLAGHDIEDLELAAEKLKEWLSGMEGVFDVADSFEAGKDELQLKIRPSAEAVGLTMRDLARQVRQGFYGEEAQRIQRGRDDVKVMVRYPEAERKSLADVRGMRIRAPGGDELPFSVVAEAELGRGYSAIQRTNRARTIAVTASVNENKQDINEVVAILNQEVLPQIQSEHPDISYAFEGERREQAETLGGLANGFVFALLLIFVLMAIPFKSYVQPLIIMSVIPFGLIGAVIGHVVMGMDFSIMSLLGIVALAGVVVNDSLVMVDFVNRRRAEGGELIDAVKTAGVARFRPILLTSLTTFAGLTPLLLEKSVQASFMIPMGVSLGFGVLFATALTLVLVPALYMILDDFTRFFRALYGTPEAAPR